MSKPAKPAAPGPAPGADGDKAPAKKGGKKKLMTIVLAVLLVCGGAGGWFSGVLPKMLGMGPHEKTDGANAEGKDGGKADPGKQTAAAEGKAPIFMDLPDIVANLDSGPRRATFVKLRAKLELSKPEDKAPLEAAMPRVLDLFQGYLREMRPEELRGSASTYRLREELLARTNLAAPPAHAVAVLFTEILVQ